MHQTLGRSMSFNVEQMTALFTRSDGTYLCARWGRPIAAVIFGLEESSLGLFKGAIESIVHLAGHEMAEIDPELGANLMMFFCHSWDELVLVPKLEAMVPDLTALCARLTAAKANQYRSFRFDADGTIKAAFVFICMDEAMAGQDAHGLALAQAVQIILVWSDQAFLAGAPLGIYDGAVVLRPEIAAVIRAAYDKTMPRVAHDKSHGLRLSARVISALEAC